MISRKHLAWIPAGAAVSFGTSFVFGDLLTLPVDAYYLVYFLAVTLFLTVYVRSTGLDVAGLLSRRLALGLVLGLIFGLLMVQNVLARPETARLTGGTLLWAVGWRGLVYGAADGLILQPNMGSTIMSVPTLVSANPMASVLSHTFLHVAAVIHSPYTELFLPPHRD